MSRIPLTPGVKERVSANFVQTNADNQMGRSKPVGYLILASGCWEWTGSRCGFNNQYGQGRFGGRRRLAHRAIYEQFRGPIPRGLVLDHLCRNPICVNPSHLEAVPQRTNVMRGLGICAANVNKVFCPQGHAYTPENTCTVAGKRHCRTCGRERARRNRQAKKAKLCA